MSRKIQVYPDRHNGAPRFESIEKSLSWWMKHQRIGVLNVSQEAVAKRVGIARATYSTYETGKQAPNLKEFLKICRALYIPYLQVIDDAEWEL